MMTRSEDAFRHFKAELVGLYFWNASSLEKNGSTFV